MSSSSSRAVTKLWLCRSKLHRRTGRDLGDQDSVASLCFCPEKSTISCCQELRSGRTVVRQGGDPQRKRHFAQHDIPVFYGKLLKGTAQLFRTAARVFQGRLGENQRELFPSVAAGQVAAADEFRQIISQFPQHRVTSIVTEHVVELFEPVH